jgi:hypothetical protein
VLSLAGIPPLPDYSVATMPRSGLSLQSELGRSRAPIWAVAAFRSEPSRRSDLGRRNVLIWAANAFG